MSLYTVCCQKLKRQYRYISPVAHDWFPGVVSLLEMSCVLPKAKATMSLKCKSCVVCCQKLKRQCSYILWHKIGTPAWFHCSIWIIWIATMSLYASHVLYVANSESDNVAIRSTRPARKLYVRNGHAFPTDMQSRTPLTQFQTT